MRQAIQQALQQAHQYPDGRLTKEAAEETRRRQLEAQQKFRDDPALFEQCFLAGTLPT